MIENFVSPGELEFLFKIALSIIAGFLIGSERESRGKDAGISTNTMVITGAMAFTVLSTLADPETPTRIAAQIITGIGFIGAGLIIKDGPNVRNLTTAASIWFAGAIGMSFGFGYYVIGILRRPATLPSHLGSATGI